MLNDIQRNEEEERFKLDRCTLLDLLKAEGIKPAEE